MIPEIIDVDCKEERRVFFDESSDEMLWERLTEELAAK